VTDQVGSPTYAPDLADAIMQLVERDSTGILHVTNSGSCSWFALAQAIAREVGVNPARIAPIPAGKLGLQARRPANSVLANTAWKALGLSPLRPWDTALRARVAHR
jgi:dTDP-4-dehydrorhamnose reductase